MNSTIQNFGETLSLSVDEGMAELPYSSKPVIEALSGSNEYIDVTNLKTTVRTLHLAQVRANPWGSDYLIDRFRCAWQCVLVRTCGTCFRVHGANSLYGAVVGTMVKK